MKLSKAEEKYRKKFVQEHHFNKEEKKIFREAQKSLNIPFKKIYIDCKTGKSYAFLLNISTMRMNKAQRKVGTSAKKIISAIMGLAVAIGVSGIAESEMKTDGKTCST